MTPNYQKQGIGTMLVNVAVEKARMLGFKNLYLFTFDPNIPEYYKCLGWRTKGIDELENKGTF